MNSLGELEIVSSVEIVLHLHEACIETTARRAWRQLLNDYLEDGTSDVEAEGALELLRHFLENNDFSSIRASHPEISGGTPQKVKLSLESKGDVSWSIVS